VSREYKNMVLVGTGNLAWHLGHALVQNGIQVSLVLGRTEASTLELAKGIHAERTGRPEDLDPDADICIICISDDAIIPVLDQMKPGRCLMLHTAGSVPMDVFNGRALNYGVLYPFQTFTKGRAVQFGNIPVLIEANSDQNLETVRQLAEKISGRVMEGNSEQRMYLHLAAVFAANFSNHMFALAEKLALEHDLPFELLKSLIQEMTAKAMSMSPAKAQTGPAVRHNLKVLGKHVDLLEGHPDLQQMYRLISESIMKASGDSPVG